MTSSAGMKVFVGCSTAPQNIGVILHGSILSLEIMCDARSIVTTNPLSQHAIATAALTSQQACPATGRIGIPMAVRSLLSAILIVSLLIIGGCQASGPKRLDTATASVDQTREQLEAGADQIDEVMASLDAMRGAQDMGKAFGRYAKAVDRLETTADRVRARREAMRARMEDHLQKWNEELAGINNQDMRQISSQRHAELTEALQQLGQALDTLKAAYEPLISDLRDIRLVLANDLSVGGLKVAQPAIDEAIKHAAAVRGEITKTNVALDQAVSQFKR